MVEASGADAGLPNLNLTPDEKRVFGQLFKQADTENVGVVTGEIAVKFFEKTRLDSRILGEIWQLADQENRGFLTPAGFSIALRLIGHAQANREPSTEIALQPGPIPRFDGFTPAPPPLAPAPTGTPQPISAQGTGNGPIRIPPLTPEKVAQYASLFERQPLQAGNMLSGEQARQIFEKSNLPNEVLGRIWQLADTEQRGALVLTEFVIAMHLLTSMKTGALRALPNILPAALYEAATRRSSVSGRPMSPTGAAPLSAIPRQLSGQAGLQMPMRTGSPSGSHIRSPLAPPPTNDGWLITPADKARFDVIYETLDKGKKGFITGEEAVPFFGQSNLPEDALAQIWDLADIRSEGRLNRDEFAVAMYLIRQQRTKQGGLPSVLPQNLMPPSMRTQARPPTATSPFDAPHSQQAPQIQQPAPPKPASALDDLFGLDSLSAAPAPAQRAMVTGGSNDPFASSGSPVAPSSPARISPTPTGGFKPFVPSSTFGRALTAQPTGESTSSATAFPRSAAPPQPTVSEDLLGEEDTESNKFTTGNDTMELANLSNQIGTLSKSMQDVQGQRNATQAELTQTNQQKKNFEQRLAQLRTMYENQAKDVRELQDKLNASRNETKKLQTEMAMIQATHQDLQTQHQTIATALQADQQENANLKERIRAVNGEVAALKPQIEKLKSEARQQKGLVAINKKQLATNEAEREKLKTESEDLTKENLELARQLNQSPSSSAIVPPQQVASPAPSNASANNPFFRRTGSTDMMGSFASPGAPKTFNDKSFDDVFGPAISSSGHPPPAGFKPQHTGASATSTGSFATPMSTTPAVSRQATLAAEQPPPLPESRQITSNFLPFGDATESLTSSRQVSPPMSRVGVDTPATEAPAPLEPTATGQSFGSGVAPDARPLTSNGTGPESYFTDSAKEETDAPGSSSDPFAAMDQHKAKDDFDSAFASFKAAKGANAGSDTSSNEAPKGVAAFHSEFPPISELEKDDESDSDDDAAGFEDDFAPASPGAKTTDKPGSPTLSKAVAGESELPAETEQVSAPAPTSPSARNLSDAQADDIFGSAPSSGTFSEPAPIPPTTTTNTAPPPKQASTFDDLDEEFADLEDAKEGSTADDDFQTISRSGIDDFNPVFDSSPPPSHSTKSESITAPAGAAPFGTEGSFDFASVSNTSASNLGASTTTAGSATVGAGEGGATGPTQPDPHDWDAIFASLDDAPPAASGSPPPDAQTPTTAEGVKDNGSVLAPPRPTPGRALTDDGEHDDPILKNLTGMGYSRTDALGALEKYDYNLERAANYLASQS